MRIRQQEILAELGVLALQGTGFIDLLNHTARLTDPRGWPQNTAKYWNIFRLRNDCSFVRGLGGMRE